MGRPSLATVDQAPRFPVAQSGTWSSPSTSRSTVRGSRSDQRSGYSCSNRRAIACHGSCLTRSRFRGTRIRAGSRTRHSIRTARQRRAASKALTSHLVRLCGVRLIGLKSVWTSPVAQAAAKYAENAPAATACCNACRTCVTTNVVRMGVAGLGALGLSGRRLGRRLLAR